MRRSSVIAEPHQIASTSPSASARANRSQRWNAHTSSRPSAVGHAGRGARLVARRGCRRRSSRTAAARPCRRSRASAAPGDGHASAAGAKSRRCTACGSRPRATSSDRTPRPCSARRAAGSGCRAGAGSLVPARVGGDHVRDDRAPLARRPARSAASRASVQPSWNARRPPAPRSAPTRRSAHSVARPRACSRASRPARGTGRPRRVRPLVRAPDVVDRAACRPRVVERDPAGRHVLRHEPARVGGVLVGEQRLARRRLPDRVVLQEPHARRPGERAANAPLRRDERRRGERASAFQTLHSCRVRRAG